MTPSPRTSLPLDDDLASFSQSIADVVLASVNRGAAAASGRSTATLPASGSSLERRAAAVLGGAHPPGAMPTRAFRTPPRRLSRSVVTALDFTSPKSVVDQALEKKLVMLPSGITAALSKTEPDNLAALLGAGSPVASTTVGTAGAPALSPAPRELRLMIHRITCTQKVGFELTDWDGIDQILCGGLGWNSLVDPDTIGPGTTTSPHYRKVPQFEIGKFRKDGQAVDLRPDRAFCSWDLRLPGGWPRFFFGDIRLAERDSGQDFAAFLKLLWDQIAPQVIDLVSKIVEDAAKGAAQGASAGSVAGVGGTAASGQVWLLVVGPLAGAALGAAMGALTSWFVEDTKDDILEAADLPLTEVLMDQTSGFAGRNKTEMRMIEYVRAGSTGRYRIQYYWLLS
ncbi:hypothetical protein MRU69_05670 [Kocuria flava]|uniref:hypothetical protein n=1 Tax=Kocuria flava TaxID=446860 RepID=UPI001FF51A5B|nr:hypothetical protein [Kocuria flava]MCJ8504317.1 hypothetical protein [Kocuria flava]MCJ8504356.1 hypothetical protein [Kocuria flava]